MIANDTPIIPELVAERVAIEEIPGSRNIRPMVRYLCARAERHYASPQFRRRIRGKDGMEALEAFMTHWLRGVMASYSRRAGCTY